MKKLILISLLIFSSVAFGCSCMAPNKDLKVDIQESTQFADSVALIRIESSYSKGYRREYNETQITQAKVLHTWKGSNSDKLTTKTNITGGMCGYEFKAGEIYLAYLKLKDDQTFSTGLCSRTSPALDKQEEINILNNLTGKVLEVPIEKFVKLHSKVLDVDKFVDDNLGVDHNILVDTQGKIHSVNHRLICGYEQYEIQADFTGLHCWLLTPQNNKAVKIHLQSSDAEESAEEITGGRIFFDKIAIGYTTRNFKCTIKFDYQIISQVKEEYQVNPNQENCQPF